MGKAITYSEVLQNTQNFHQYKKSSFFLFMLLDSLSNIYDMKSFINELTKDYFWILIPPVAWILIFTSAYRVILVLELVQLCCRYIVKKKERVFRNLLSKVCLKERVWRSDKDLFWIRWQSKKHPPKQTQTITTTTKPNKHKKIPLSLLIVQRLTNICMKTSRGQCIRISHFKVIWYVQKENLRALWSRNGTFRS